MASLSLIYTYYFGRCSSELAELIRIPCSRRRSTRYSDRLLHFSVTSPSCYKDVHVDSSVLAHLDSGILCLYNAFL